MGHRGGAHTAPPPQHAHWIDPSTLEATDRFIEAVKTAPVFLLFTCLRTARFPLEKIVQQTVPERLAALLKELKGRRRH
jgi:hypothetical protein